MSLPSDDESHERQESVYRYFMEKLIGLERDAIHEGDVRNDSYWEVEEAVARKSFLTVCSD